MEPVKVKYGRPTEEQRAKFYPEMHAPVIDPAKIRINIWFKWEPHSWERAAFSKYGAFRQVDTADNKKAKKKLVERFEWSYPDWKTIEHRRLGVQMCFRTANDSKDADNLAKLVHDAFNKKIWHDDRQIKELYARVIVSTAPPFTQLVVYLLDEVPNV